MTRHRIFLETELVVGAKHLLNDKHSHYLKNVLRLKQNCELEIFNGVDNTVAIASIISISKKVEVKLTKILQIDRENNFAINVFHGLCESSKYDFLLQKLTELGVSTYTPVITKLANKKLLNNIEKKYRKWQDIIVAACCQSRRNTLMKIEPVIELETLLSQYSGYILDPQASSSEFKGKQFELNILIGPESGFTESEISHSDNWDKIKLGSRILRTETAVISAVSIMNYLL